MQIQTDVLKTAREELTNTKQQLEQVSLAKVLLEEPFKNFVSLTVPLILTRFTFLVQEAMEQKAAVHAKQSDESRDECQKLAHDLVHSAACCCLITLSKVGKLQDAHVEHIL